MYLKSLELQGFKSFANKIILQFHNGITGVVGPNGSGKSNVSDAIRWVLGEQSAKQLRGGSMQDVIFAGTQSRKAMSLAYVAITLDNSDHALSIDYEEVTVARRLYRSGESEYLINGTTVRMRDIQELFYDTGIGKEGYSLIGQGQVEKILNGKPDERRELFDEAAGIVKYKHRKATAVKKLESEQANLVRVNDILSELGRQVGPLKAQSETAKIYLARRDEMRICDVNQFLIENDRFEDDLKAAKDRLDTAVSQQNDTKQALEHAKAQYELLDEEIHKLDEQIYASNEDKTKVRLDRQSNAAKIDQARDQIEALSRSDEDLRIREQRLKQEITGRETSLAASGKRKADLAAETESTMKEMEDAERSAGYLREQIAEINAQLENKNSDIIRILNERTDIQTGRERAATMIEQISLRESELNSRELTLRSEESDQSRDRKELDRQRADAEKETETLQQQSDRLGTQLEEVHQRFLSGSEQLAKVREDYQRESSRLETIRAITERYEGYGNSIKRVMEQKDREKGIIGVVADIIQTSRQYELAVETALGAQIQNIVTVDEQTAKRMIAFLKENRFGRATFLPLNAMKNSKRFSNQDALREPGVIGLASGLITCEERFADLAQYLLGRTLVAERIDDAIALARRYHYSLRIVTLDGELLSPGGSMTGGAFKNTSNLLGRRREIEDETKKIERIRKRLDELTRQVEEDHTKRNRLRDEIAALSGLIQQNEFDKSTLNQKMADLSGRITETRGARDRIAQERAQIAQEKTALQTEQQQTSAQLDQSGVSEKKTNEVIASLNDQLSKLNADLTAKDSALSQIRVKLAGFRQEENFIAQNLERLADEVRFRKEECEEIGYRLAANESARETKTEEIASYTQMITALKEEEERLERQLLAFSETKTAKAEQQKSFFETRESLSEESMRIDREIFRLEEQQKKLEEGREKSIAYLWEEYELTPVQCRSLRNEEIGSLQTIRKRLTELKKEIKALGNVNVNAIEEYKEVSERYEFLTAQHEDLVKSADDLQKIIEKLDEGMKAQFREQFARIQTEFDQTFRELFGGGKGTLELVEEEDILEAGIRVIAQPPGKKLQNMMQLSGGEKSLTAIALLFAIQNLKPSPFCLLDEIESALDEANVDRFARYLHKLSKHTQFIVITHRRGSMSSCDRLYGITMQEKGISALVSVDLVEKELDA